ncbi:MAG: DUF2059 domain-containing protein [Victivallaceae bacterium]|nr:DUF2059 domain-containing protein [Victivallaceae bacterium]
MRKIAVAIILAAACILPTFAAGQTDSEANYELCYKLFKTMQMDKTTERNITTMVDLQIRNMPMLASVRTEMLSFFGKYLSFDATKKDLARIYLQHFTPAEIQELTKFYETKLGQKMALSQPQLVEESARLGEQQVKAHIPELQALIRAKFQSMAPAATPNAKAPAAPAAK